ncbi:hypothetical protein [Clostridium sp. AF32-12BH]|nr:hypothetical protein [Clostridium sp. AF32-12BH]
MKEITIALLSEDYEKLQKLAMKNGFRKSSEFARKELEDRIRAEYRRLLS